MRLKTIIDKLEENMEKPYTTLQLREFLFSHGILWDGKNKNGKDCFNNIKAEVQLFDKNNYMDETIILSIDADVNILVDENTLKIYVENCEVIYEYFNIPSSSRLLLDDYSDEWKESLLNYPPERGE